MRSSCARSIALITRSTHRSPYLAGRPRACCSTGQQTIEDRRARCRDVAAERHAWRRPSIAPTRSMPAGPAGHRFARLGAQIDAGQLNSVERWIWSSPWPAGRPRAGTHADGPRARASPGHSLRALSDPLALTGGTLDWGEDAVTAVLGPDEPGLPVLTLGGGRGSAVRRDELIAADGAMRGLPQIHPHIEHYCVNDPSCTRRSRRSWTRPPMRCCGWPGGAVLRGR